MAVDGTSQSSPVFAGIFSLITDHRLNAGLPPLGPLGPRIYHVAKAHPGAAFEDVVVGNSRTSCDNGFPAAPGWDPTTGWCVAVGRSQLQSIAVCSCPLMSPPSISAGTQGATSVARVA